jgi:hypothetical protein
MFSVSKYLYKKCDENYVVLCMMFHSNELSADMSPYNKTDLEVKNYLDKMREYFNKLFNYYDVKSIGLSEVTDIL